MPNTKVSADRREECLASAARWRAYATDPNITEGLRNTCILAARSLELQAEDGIARCVCCFKPFGSHGNGWQAPNRRDAGVRS